MVLYSGMSTLLRRRVGKIEVCINGLLTGLIFMNHFKEGVSELDIVVIVHTGYGFGTGFFISDNLIATNAHVVWYHPDVVIVGHDNLITKGRVEYIDFEHDIAIIKVDTDVVEPTIDINVDTLPYGTPIYSLGHGDMRWFMYKYGTIEVPLWMIEGRLDMIYYIANHTIYNGDSGSPVFDDNGKIIGMLSRGSETHSYIIPIDYVVSVMM